jgi:hypothetical protein
MMYLVQELYDLRTSMLQESLIGVFLDKWEPDKAGNRRTDLWSMSTMNISSLFSKISTWVHNDTTKNGVKKYTWTQKYFQLFK